jgi:hypothetical protein
MTEVDEMAALDVGRAVPGVRGRPQLPGLSPAIVEDDRPTSPTVAKVSRVLGETRSIPRQRLHSSPEVPLSDNDCGTLVNGPPRQRDADFSENLTSA